MIRARLRAMLTCPIELWSALVAVFWAKSLFWFGGTLDGNPAYRVATAIWDTGDWELVAFSVGCFQLLTVFVGHRFVLGFGSAIAAWFYCSLALAVWSSNAVAPGWTLLAGWSLINIHSALLRGCRR